MDAEFWDYLISTKRETGMLMYEQDWLDDEFDGLQALAQYVQCVCVCSCTTRTQAHLNAHARTRINTNTHAHTHTHTHRNATLGRMWLLQMGDAAARQGVTIQYCMSHVRHILQVCVYVRVCGCVCACMYRLHAPRHAQSSLSSVARVAIFHVTKTMCACEPLRAPLISRAQSGIVARKTGYFTVS